VHLITVPATLTCRDCGQTADTTDVLAVCPHCAGENVDITGGDEMTLESITYEPASPSEPASSSEPASPSAAERG
jgi:hydrogenase nickel incorporation protein HypA/HybF